MPEELGVALLASGMGLAIIAVVSLVLSFFVALPCPPTKRAAWTAGLAYLAATVILMFGGIPGFETMAPLIALPGGLITYFYWRSSFRRGWIDSPEMLSEGERAEDDDWRVGLLRFLALFVLLLGVAAVRWAIREGPW